MASFSRLSPPDTVAIAPGNKFAVIAVPESGAGYAPGPVINLGEGFAVSHALPAAALDTWKERLGGIHTEELERTALFLWSFRESPRPGMIDDENRQLERDVYRLYLGLLVGMSNFSHGRLTLVSGGNESGVARARTLTTYPRTWRTPGSSCPSLTVARLRLVGQLAKALRQHTDKPDNRPVRALRAFRQGAEASELDIRLHQFVRSIDAFLNSHNAKQFSTRLGRVCAGRSQGGLDELYRIRSGIEHLHGPYKRMVKNPRGGRLLRLVHRCTQAEAVARYMLQTYLLRPSLWPTFEQVSSIDAFWNSSIGRIRSLWGSQIHFPSILQDFNSWLFKREVATS
jgi:hypothetical protein